MKIFIICAAIHLPEMNKTYYGHRHPHCIEAKNGELSWNMSRKQIKQVKEIQGFVTNEGKFVDRKEAYLIAKESNQILDSSKTRGLELYSEDLY